MHVGRPRRQTLGLGIYDPWLVRLWAEQRLDPIHYMGDSPRCLSGRRRKPLTNKRLQQPALYQPALLVSGEWKLILGLERDIAPRCPQEMSGLPRRPRESISLLVTQGEHKKTAFSYWQRRQGGLH